MAKRKNNINRIFNGRDYYYAYRLPPDVFGKRKRIYAKTEEELLAKIEKINQEKKENMQTYKPSAKKLSDYIIYYFRHATECFATADIERMQLLFEKNILNSKIDKDIDALTTEEINDHYNKLSELYTSNHISEVNTLVQNAASLAAEDGIGINIDFSKIVIPKINVKRGKDSYILSPDEFEIMLNYCINDKHSKFGNNESLIILFMLTGISASSLGNLQCKDVDLKRGVLILEDREYNLSNEAKQWLTEHFKESEFKSDNDYVFATKSKIPPTGISVLYTIKAIAKQCCLPNGVNRTNLQKAYVISELNKGTSRDTLCQRLGFKSPKTITAIEREYKLSRYNPNEDN